MSKYHSDNNLFVTKVTLLVSNINESLDFYQKSLGLKLKKQEGNVYSLGTSERELVDLVYDSKAIKRGRTTGLYHFAILLPNRKYLGQLINHFIKIEQKIVGGSDHGVSEALYLKDPDGNGIEIYADRDDSLWQYENNEIIMYTEGMDYESIIKDAYQDEWQGLPNGTVMGHLHLHVADLDVASNFFIDVIGFNQMLFYGESALFLSSDGYHHHIGLNTWNGTDIFNRPMNMVGLVAYELNIPKKNEEDFFKRLRDNKIEMLLDNSKHYIKDINDVRVYFKVIK
ncbi:MAG: VOC family protein [Acholeplasma sp.]|nr:VOC family protein [Acholeplasma sp.]